jgi:hypothetical protein
MARRPLEPQISPEAAREAEEQRKLETFIVEAQTAALLVVKRKRDKPEISALSCNDQRKPDFTNEQVFSANKLDALLAAFTSWTTVTETSIYGDPILLLDLAKIDHFRPRSLSREQQFQGLSIGLEGGAYVKMPEGFASISFISFMHQFTKQGIKPQICTVTVEEENIAERQLSEAAAVTIEAHMALERAGILALQAREVIEACKRRITLNDPSPVEANAATPTLAFKRLIS